MNNKTAFIFPAFITEFTHNELEFLNQNSVDLNNYLLKISEILNIELPNFSYDSGDYAKNELYSQLLTYAFSCSFSDILNSRQIVPHVVAGYSMGIYAALYAVKSISFEDGASLIYKAYNLVGELAQTKLYGMAAIIGLSVGDVNNLIIENALALEIINVNNEYSLVIAGKKNEITILLNKAKEEGAITTAELTVNTPYHSKYLLRYAIPFEEFINTISINDPIISVISTFDRREISEIYEVKAELVFNLTQKINWHKTMQKLIDNSIKEVYECGAGKDLKKISRFICGDYKMKSVYRLK